MPTFTRNGFSTWYEDTGSGDPIVFICGLSADLQVWRFQVPELGKTHRVITYDNRGAGRSDAPDEPYAIAQMADDLVALLDHLGVDRAAIAGWSMGGVIAQTLALAHPQRVARLLLLGSFAAPDGYLAAAISNWVNVRRSNMSYEQVVRHVARLVYSPALANKPQAYEAFIQAMLSNPFRQTEHGFFRQAAALLAYAAPDRLGELAAPTTVLVGEHDQLTPPYLSMKLAQAIPGARLQVLPAGHSGFVERPDDWTTAIRDALAGGHTVR
jgi:pimeloyl-ACP methyl ester carboxylesterase